MARKKKRPEASLADYIAIALSPLLIMALVGSLVFFLLEICYVGQYSGQLQWTLFFFVFAIVLIARISIEQGDAKAGVYGLALAGAVFLALQKFVEYPSGSSMAAFGWAINLALIGIAWWCAHHLTWDCTHIDDAVDEAGGGVLEAAGLDQDAPKTFAEHDDTDLLKDWKPNKKDPRPGLVAWWDRYQAYQERQRKKPHKPGVWVVWFSLAALPIFGLGQSLIPADEVDRRRYVFWLMVFYVASGLGLLLTTSFLGLRRYLRQRGLKMPASMTGIWIGLGALLIASLMFVGALLPRPYGEYQIISFTPLGSKDREASKYALKRDGKGKGEGAASNDPKQKDADAQSGSGKQKSKDAQTSRSSSKGQPDRNSSQSSQSGKGQKSGKQGDQAKGQGKDENSPNARDPQKQGKEDQAQKDNEQRDDSKEENRKQERDDEGRSGSNSSRPQSSSSSSPISDVTAKLGWLGNVLKWIVFAILALVVAFYVFRSGLKFLANFTAWARNLLSALEAWWNSLFGSKSRAQESDAEAEEEERKPQPRPFKFYHNPFNDGSAHGQSPDEVVRYSFDAFQAWAYERGLERQPQETPLEFAQRVGQEFPGLDNDSRKLAGYYARSLYGRGRLTSACLSAVEQFWVSLESAERRPVATP